MYADDTTVYCTVENADEAVDQLNEARKESYTWYLK